MITKSDLAEKIKRRLGYPVVKVELDTSQIYDAINYSRNKFVRWAVGNATQETYFTIMLSAGQVIYDMPVGVVEIISYEDSGSTTGINTLFTIDNFFYNQGLYDSLLDSSGTGYTLVSYHIAKDFIETLDRYQVSNYNWKYHRYTNQLEINPAPSTGNNLIINGVTYDSPGYILLRSYMIEGSTVSDSWVSGDSDEYIYNSSWILDYATAMCKITLGLIRRKFANFNSIGNNGISMDGDMLVSEGKEELQQLEEDLKLEEIYEGYPIICG